MAENNLGQVSAVWLENSEPPHKNVLWIKTVNQLTGEKAGFIWNGIEWINIQGQGFYWKGNFTLATNYTKNDVVFFEDALYIKLNDVVNNEDNPNENIHFDVFLPSTVPFGVTGSIQVKDVNGKFFGSALFTWLGGLLSILGNVFIKGNSNNIGNAFEVRNGGNVSHFTVSNDGKVCVKNIHAIDDSLEIYAYRGIYLNSAFGYIASFERFSIIEFFAPVKAPSFTANQVTTEIVKGIDDSFPEGGTRNESGVSILDGKPKSDEFGFGDYDGLGVSISSHIRQEGGEPILIKTIEVKAGKLGLYGVEPVARQSLPLNATPQQILEALENLGVIEIIIP